MQGCQVFAELFQIKLARIGMKRKGDITHLSPAHTRSQEMLPSMEEGIKHRELCRSYWKHITVVQYDLFLLDKLYQLKTIVDNNHTLSERAQNILPN